MCPVHGNVTPHLYIIEMITISPTLVLCAHTRLSFVHHIAGECIMIISIPLCRYLFSFICKSTNTASTLLCFLLWHTHSLFAHHTVGECIMIIFPCVHVFSLSFASRLTPHQLFSAFYCSYTRFSFVHHSMWVHYDTISLCTSFLLYLQVDQH